MTITFDPIWLPGAVSAVAFLWFAWWTFSPSTWSAGLFYLPIYLLVGVALPLVPTMAVWLLWAVLT